MQINHRNISVLYAVVMHHWAVQGGMTGGASSILGREHTNPKARSAIIMKKGPTTMGCIKKVHAELIANIMNSGCMLKVEFVHNGPPLTVPMKM